MPTARGKLKSLLKSRKEKKKNPPRFRSLQLTLFKLAVWGLLFFGLISGLQALILGWREKVWISNSRLTVVVAQEDPIIYSFDPIQEKLTIFAIPHDTQVETSSSYGNLLVGNLWKLGEQEKMDGELLRLSLQKTLGIPIDAWVEERGSGLFDQNSLGWFSASWEALASGKLKTNLTFFDRASLVLGVGKLSIRDRREIDLVGNGVLVKTKLSDGMVGYKVVPEKSKIVLDILKDDLVFEEGKKIIIANATGKGGLASQTAQIGSVLGARVIGTQTSQEDVNNCEVRGKKEDINSLTSKRIASIFSCNVKETEKPGAADLEVILGKSFLEKF